MGFACRRRLARRTAQGVFSGAATGVSFALSRSTSWVRQTWPRPVWPAIAAELGHPAPETSRRRAQAPCRQAVSEMPVPSAGSVVWDLCRLVIASDIRKINGTIINNALGAIHTLPHLVTHPFHSPPPSLPLPPLLPSPPPSPSPPLSSSPPPPFSSPTPPSLSPKSVPPSDIRIACRSQRPKWWDPTPYHGTYIMPDSAQIPRATHPWVDYAQ